MDEKKLSSRSREPPSVEDLRNVVWDGDEPSTLACFAEMGVAPLDWTGPPVKPSPISSIKRRLSGLTAELGRDSALSHTCPPHRILVSPPLSSLFPSEFESARHLPPLSDEIYLLIFSFLDPTTLCRCARVCKEWKRLAYDRSLWTNFTLSDATITAELFTRVVMQRFPSRVRARNTYITGLPFVTLDEGLDPSSEIEERSNDSAISLPIPPLGPFRHGYVPRNISVIDLSSSYLASPTLAAILRVSPGLRTLDLSFCTDIDDHTIAFIGEACPSLQRLSLRMNEHLTHEGLGAVLRGCPLLRVLNLAWTSLSREALLLLPVLAPSLLELDISGSFEHLNDEIVEEICSHMPRLEVLDLSDCYAVSDGSVMALSRHCPALRALAMSRCHNITISSLRSLAEKPSLKQLNVFGCYPGVLPHVMDVCAHLQLNKQALSLVEVLQ